MAVAPLVLVDQVETSPEVPCRGPVLVATTGRGVVVPPPLVQGTLRTLGPVEGTLEGGVLLEVPLEG